MRESAWQTILKTELAYHLRKNKQQHFELKLKYWEQLLEQVRPHVALEGHSRILDVGCGCCSVLLAINKGFRVGVDPLMKEYLENFEYLQSADVIWLADTVEKMEFEEPFDIVFSINALDHVFDWRQAARNLDHCLKPGGHLILSLNCHNTVFFRWYYSLFYRIFDPHHPHHFRPSQVLGLFCDYQPIETKNIDALFFGQQEAYRKKVLKRRGINWGGAAAYLLNPLRYPLALARLLGRRPVYSKRLGQPSIFSNYLFVFNKPL